MRILWIDDEIDLLRPFVYSLRDKGYEVETASNGPDGLELFKRKDFDLVLLDEIMPGLDGLAVLRHLKEVEPAILVAMVTKSDDERMMNEAYGRLVDDFVIKPFALPQLLAVLKRLLEKKGLVEERVAREYSQTFFARENPRHWSDWIDYYLAHTRWQMLLARYGDDAIREIHDQRTRELTTAFAKYVEGVYPDWLRGRDAPVLSPRVIETFVLPELAHRPCYFFLLDSMRMDQWFLLASLLRENYEIEHRYYYSILPSATPYARNAIFAGLLPLEIERRLPQYWVYEAHGQNRFEAELLGELLRRRGRTAEVTFLKTARDEDLEQARAGLLAGRPGLHVIIVNFLDLLIHSIRSTVLLDQIVRSDGALLDLTRLWFTNSALAALLRALARTDAAICITTDHGFLRVRRPTVIQGGREISSNLRYKYGGALRCDRKTAVVLNVPADYALPASNAGIRFVIAKEDYYFVYPTKPHEYERTYKNTFQHGGISPAEMILPVGLLRAKRGKPRPA